jgi:gliotoxin/aspirochlorine biosynthesis aminotransferase
VKPIVVNTPSFSDTFTLALIPALEESFNNSEVPVKALVLSNPHNPFGLCYPREVLEACLNFCQLRGIHFISDEVYALTSFNNPEIPKPAPFISALKIDATALGCDLSRVHVIWSTSKDFGSSGIRMVGHLF